MVAEKILLGNVEELPECDKRLPDGYCGAIGMLEMGDMPCECATCKRDCEKKEKTKCDTV